MAGGASYGTVASNPAAAKHARSRAPGGRVDGDGPACSGGPRARSCDVSSQRDVPTQCDGLPHDLSLPASIVHTLGMPHGNPCCTFARMLVLGGATLLASACDEPEPEAEPVVIDFRAVVDGVPFACGERYEGIGTSEAAFEPADLRMYLHGFELIDANGERHPTTPVDDGRWQRDGFALVDFEDGTGACETGSPSTHPQVTLANEAGIDVAGVAFLIGLPAENNHLDAATAPPPLNEPGMWWSWRGGFKYIKADIRTDAGVPFYFHLGGTNCEGDPASGFSCGYANLSKVELSLDPASEAIVLDLARLYDGVDITAPVDETVDSVPGCMAFSGDPECPSMFDVLGLVFESTEPSGEAQRIFGVEARP